MSSKERKILPSVVSKEMGVFVGPVKAPLGSKLGIDKEFTFLEGDLQCIFLSSRCAKHPYVVSLQIFLTEYIVLMVRNQLFSLEKESSRRKRRDILYTNKYQKEQVDSVLVQLCSIWYQ